MSSDIGAGRTQPMTDFHKKVLNRARADIVATMTAKNLLNQLISDEILTIEERLKVLGGTGPSEQNDNLMDTIHWKPDRAYDCFKQALRGAGQDHVANLIEEKEVQLQTELQKRESRTLSACSKADSMCSDKSEHGFENVLTTDVQNLTQAITTLAMPGPVEVSASNKIRVVTILAQDKVTTPLQKTSTSELPGLQQLAICVKPEPRPTKDGIVLDSENALALPGCIENDDNGLKKKREERRRLKRARFREANRQQSGEGGYTVGVKLLVDEVRTDDDQPAPRELLQETANYIWRTLSYVVRKLKCDSLLEDISPQDQTGIYRFLMSFNSQHCKVEHVGVEPVLFVVHCMNLDSLETIVSLNREDTFATLLEDAVLEGTFAQKRRIIDVTLTTTISEEEIKLCTRVLGELETSLKVVVQTTPKRSSKVEYELYQQVETHQLAEGSEMATATRARIIQVEHSSILLTLQFQSLGDLKAFREDLDSGQLTRLFENMLITDDIKEKYDLDNLGLSVTLVDSWEYEMCEMELALIGEREEDLADDNPDDRNQLETGKEERNCCRHFRLEAQRLAGKVRRLEEENKCLSEEVRTLRETNILEGLRGDLELSENETEIGEPLLGSWLDEYLDPVSKRRSPSPILPSSDLSHCSSDCGSTEDFPLFQDEVPSKCSATSLLDTDDVGSPQQSSGMALLREKLRKLSQARKSTHEGQS